MSTNLILSIQTELAQNIDPKRRDHIFETHSSECKYLGVRIPVVRKISAKYYKELKNKPLQQVIELCTELLNLGFDEYKIIAFDWLNKRLKELEIKHFELLENWLFNYILDWAVCDDLCTGVLGSFILKYNQIEPKILVWATSKNRWVRRALAVSLIASLRKSQNLGLCFKIANLLLLDSDTMVQKGYGWMLKEASNKFPTEVLSFVKERETKMPRLAYRYALEKLIS